MTPRVRTSPFFSILIAGAFFFTCVVHADDPVQRTPVKSSSLASVGYNEKEQVLEIEFRNSGIYRYSGVTKEFFSQFMTANSKGGFFALKIRGKFSFSKVNTSSIAGQ